MKKTTILGAAAAALLVYMGYQGFVTLRSKAAQQSEATEAVARWKQSYRALDASLSQWEARYPNLSDFNDTLGLYRSLRLQDVGLGSSPDTISIISKAPVMANGVDIRLAKICLASTAANSTAGLQVDAPTYAGLLDGVRRLAQRPDIYVGGMSILGTGDRPKAILTDFCLLLRVEPN
ncbi:hypothetical protein J3A72_000449 [Stenotrophomonas sp. PvP093]|uniref:hypothetical protein n=1 Tax=unclassified Stenotrophomonas TaxID=196198 RepID=UPI001AEB8E77|nr:hypothetical protein [Stenotrophomonas sp. PvP093]MBP2480157.1 hypothetical protein [Stenotrophomonas sp. PvP093]